MKKAATSPTGLGALWLLALVLGVTGCQTSGSRSLAQRWGDNQVAHEVKRALSRDASYKYPNVHPTVYEGTVQLGGFVETPEQRQTAAQLAARARGVRQIINCIALNPAPPIREQFPTPAPAPVVTPVAVPSAPPAAAPAPTPAVTPAQPLTMEQTPAPAAARARLRVGGHVPTQGAGAADLLGR